MKKPLLCLTALFVFLSACSKKEETPQQITLQFFNVLYNEHDLEKAEAFCTEESKANLRSTIRAIQGAMQIIDESDRQHYKYSIVEERSKIENDTAIMTVSSSLDTMTMQIRLVKITEIWKVDFNYDEHVMEKELIDEVLKIMKPFSDSITVQIDTSHSY